MYPKKGIAVIWSPGHNLSEMVDDIRAPAAWRRPKTKIYDYNQDMGCAYYKVLFGQYAQSWNVQQFCSSSSYHINDQNLNIWFQPMIDYVDTKERQGIFFERPVSTEKAPKYSFEEAFNSTP